ncbi:DEAD/DEAH box helicase [Candidatus Gracilibacteria bacterium]|nr:DEAD/DEAH box helicase [Candidatus Gracilibacteria bacterium]
MKFTQLNLVSPLHKALEQQGFDTATDIQKEVLPYALDGKDILGCAQTGSGKTLAFALPVINNLYAVNSDADKKYAEMLGTLDEKERKKAKKEKKKNPRKIGSLILAPTRELAIQIGETLSPYCTNTNIKHTIIYGGKSQFHQVQALTKGVDILVATPGRLLDLIEQGFVDITHISSFILDEADKMLEMGFFEDITKVIKLLPSKRQSLFFSATMPQKIKKLADSILQDAEEIIIERVAITAPDIKQEVYLVNQAQKRHALQYLIKKEEFESIIVFVKTKDDTETVLKYVQAAGIVGDNMHRNRSQNARQKALLHLKTGEIKVLVATDIASRGIDIDNLSCVINFDLPQEEETYVHRIGRTARAGKKGVAITLCVPEQEQKLQKIEELIGKTITVNQSKEYMKEELAFVSKEKTKIYSFGDTPRGPTGRKKKHYGKKKK